MAALELNPARINLMVKMNYHKITSKGFTWSITKDGWKDETSGLVWKFNDESGEFVFDKAVEKFGHALPSSTEWEVAEEHGIREVLELESKYYWSASVVSVNQSSAWYFYSGKGYVSFSLLDYSYSVRLILR